MLGTFLGRVVDSLKVAAYDIYFSVDDSLFVLLFEDTTDTSAQIEADFGHTYAFFSVAKDHVGHMEAAPETPDTTITIGLWHNGREPLDVNDDTYVSPQDVLWVISYLNDPGSGRPPASPETPPPYLDVNGDNWVSPIDALYVIAYLNSGESEAEASVDVLSSGSTSGFASLPERPATDTTYSAEPEVTVRSVLDAYHDEDLLPGLEALDSEAISELTLLRHVSFDHELEGLFEDTDLGTDTDLETLLEVMAGDTLRWR